MAKKTLIGWTNATFNAWQGCTQISPACENCYAAALAKRSGQVKWGAGEPRRRTTPSNWRQPIKWNEEAQRNGMRLRVFCNSLSDVFDNEVPDEWRQDLWNLILATPYLDWILLTKRIGNTKDMLPYGFGTEAYSNIWLGITVANQQEADRDIPKLLAINAPTTFLSIEPMLGEIDLHKAGAFFAGPCGGGGETGPVEYDCVGFVDWVIVGGESGPNARPTHLKWIRKLQIQCEGAGIAFFFKQWGEWVGGIGEKGSFIYLQNGQNTVTDATTHYWGNGVISQRVGKKHAGNTLDGVIYEQFPRRK
jgi:protein gp37